MEDVEGLYMIHDLINLFHQYEWYFENNKGCTNRQFGEADAAGEL